MRSSLAFCDLAIAFSVESIDLIFQGTSLEGKKMVTIPECEGLFEPLLRILEDNMAASDDQVDAYLRMTE